jgi:hypothetical protein
MKKIFRCIPIIFLLILSACSKDLIQEPITDKNTANFLQTEKEVEEYVNATYGALQSTGLYGLYLPAIAEVPSDIVFEEVPANDAAVFSQLDDFTVNANNNLLAVNYRDSYVAIQRANVVLNRIDKISFGIDSIKSSRKGEMKFIRALVYFNLVRTFGDVPLVTSETTDANLYFGQGRSLKSAVYNQIVTDLKEASDALLTKPSNQGRTTKWAARALLAKVYLTLGSASLAKAQLDQVYSSNLFGLLPKPSDVFTSANEGSKEIIFSVQFASGINGNTEGSQLFVQASPSGTQSGAKGHILPSQNLYAQYGSTDLRKGVYVDIVPGSGIPYCKKYIKPTTNINDGGSDYVVLRFADVLLMMAEAENELGNTLLAISYLNKVRNRAGLNNTLATSQSEVRVAIDAERQLELIGEGHRWFDLLRSGNAVSIMNNFFKANNKNIIIDDHNLVMPIPQGQINTDPSIVQNIGYN